MIIIGTYGIFPMGDLKKILITGLPGIGKTTLIKGLSNTLKDFHPVGFYTEEIRKAGERKGFELISLDGRKGVLAHKEIKSPYRVGKYGVDVRGFDGFLDTIPWTDPSTRLIIIDEIGKMECFSDKFRKLVSGLLDSERALIATIAMKGGGLIAQIKAREEIRLFEVTLKNRDELLPEILRAMGKS